MEIWYGGDYYIAYRLFIKKLMGRVGNMKNIIVRQAMDKDMEEIKSVVRSAFDRPGKNEFFNEWEFAKRVRNDSEFIPELCFVATNNNQIIGYMLLSKALIGVNEGLTLGPLAVKPPYQRKGIGKKLIQYGLEKAKGLNFEWVALTGGDYYTQFGFESALRHGIAIGEDHPENLYLKIKFLNGNISVPGKIKFCDSFYDEDGKLL